MTPTTVSPLFKALQCQQTGCLNEADVVFKFADRPCGCPRTDPSSNVLFLCDHHARGKFKNMVNPGYHCNDCEDQYDGIKNLLSWERL